MEGGGASACTACGTGSYGIALGQAIRDRACTSCAAGSYSGATTASTACAQRNLTWLFKDPENGFYYLNLPRPHSAGFQSGGTGATAVPWTKVRIHSVLSGELTSIQLFVSYLGDPGKPCASSTYDWKYKSGPAVDFGGIATWNKVQGVSIDLRGSPFGLKDGVNSWEGAYRYTTYVDGVGYGVAPCS